MNFNQYCYTKNGLGISYAHKDSSTKQTHRAEITWLKLPNRASECKSPIFPMRLTPSQCEVFCVASLKLQGMLQVGHIT